MAGIDKFTYVHSIVHPDYLKRGQLFKFRGPWDFTGIWTTLPSIRRPTFGALIAGTSTEPAHYAADEYEELTQITDFGVWCSEVIKSNYFLNAFMFNPKLFVSPVSNKLAPIDNNISVSSDDSVGYIFEEGSLSNYLQVYGASSAQVSDTGEYEPLEGDLDDDMSFDPTSKPSDDDHADNTDQQDDEDDSESTAVVDLSNNPKLGTPFPVVPPPKFVRPVPLYPAPKMEERIFASKEELQKHIKQPPGVSADEQAAALLTLVGQLSGGTVLPNDPPPGDNGDFEDPSDGVDGQVIQDQ